jgi:uncharacterized membrane protein (UPF0127 family)
MRVSLPACPLALLIGLCACQGPKTATLEDLTTRVVKLPNGQRIRAEVLTSQEEMMRGMMFRDSLAADRGMLFIHREPGNYSYWMYQVRIPLDIIWLDSARRIVEISALTPPCQTRASECPSYGGHRRAQFVLELAGGMAARYGLRTGDRLEF